METLEKPISKAEQKRREEADAIEQLKKWIKPGDTVSTILRQVSRSGMSRHISVIVMANGVPINVSGYVATALGYRRASDGSLVVGGCGMDMGFHVVYSLSRVLFRDAFYCIGKNCPANDHTNSYGQWIQGKCFVCGQQYGEAPDRMKHNDPARTENAKYFRLNRGQKYPVCSSKCARGPWKHSDAGYALGQRWL